MKNFLKSGNWEKDGHVIAIGGTKYQIAPANLVQVCNGEETEFFSFEDVYTIADVLSCENCGKLGGWRLPTLAELKLFEAYTAFKFQYHAGIADCTCGMSVKEFADTLGLSLPGNLLIVGAVSSANHDGFTGYWADPMLSPGYMKITNHHVVVRNVNPDEYAKSKKNFDDDNPSYSYALCVRLIREIPD